jgi:hypothetical protein
VDRVETKEFMVEYSSFVKKTIFFVLQKSAALEFVAAVSLLAERATSRSASIFFKSVCHF